MNEKPITTHHHHAAHSPGSLASTAQQSLSLQHTQDKLQSLTSSYALTLYSFPWHTAAEGWKKIILKCLLRKEQISTTKTQNYFLVGEWMKTRAAFGNSQRPFNYWTPDYGTDPITIIFETGPLDRNWTTEKIKITRPNISYNTTEQTENQMTKFIYLLLHFYEGLSSTSCYTIMKGY